MSLFIDTGLFYAQHDRDASRHRTATRAFDEVLSSNYGKLYTSDYVYNECVTLTRKRTGRFRHAQRVGNCIRGVGEFPNVVELLNVSNDLFARSIETYERYRDHDLSFTDASTIAFVEHRNIDPVLAFDDDFDGLVPRIDPKAVA